MSFLRKVFKKSYPAESYDPSLLRPVILSSICTGEKTAGFQEIATGKFREVMLVKTDADIKKFREQYRIEGEIKTIY